MINLSALKENIDSEIEASKKESPDVFRCGMMLAEIVSDALEQTLDADMVTVVRCKDCKYCDKYTKWNNREYLGCSWNGEIYEVEAEHYCSYGERKMDNDNTRTSR